AVREMSRSYPELEKPFSLDDLEIVLNECDNQKATGPDRISYQHLKSLSSASKTKFLALLNAEWDKCTFPDIWKEGEVIPLRKPGKSMAEISSYRSITLTSCAGKIYERLIKDRLEWYLEKNKIFTDAQSAYRCSRSTWDNLLDLTSDLQHNLKHQRVTGVVFLDIKKAFDAVSHNA